MKNQSYLIDSYRVPRKLYRFFWQLAKDLVLPDTDQEQIRKLYHRLICHVYISIRLKSIENDDGEANLRVPIPSKLIWEKLKREVKVTVLKDNKIIFYGSYHHSNCKGKGKCREFWLNEKIFHNACMIHTDTLFDDWENLLSNGKSRATVNLMTGSSMLRPGLKNLYLNDTTLDKVPELIKESMACLQPCPINPKLIIPWARKAEVKFKREQEKLAKFRQRLQKRFPNKSIKELKRTKAYKFAARHRNKARGLYINLVTCLGTILDRQPQILQGSNGKLWSYSAAYRLQSTGRVGEVHGGFQNLYSPAKSLLLRDVPNIYNYDIQSSQAVILADEFKQGFQCEWLEKYNADKSLRQKYADQVGITVSCWKNAFYSIIMGADDGEFGAPFNVIREEVHDYEKARVIHVRFLETIQPLLDTCESWRDFLLSTTDERYVSKYGVYRWRNACGLVFRDYVRSVHGDVIDNTTGEVVTNQKILKGIKRRLASFFLQGREAYVIHSLTIQCTKHGIPVYKNEHDGLITGAEIPEELFKEVSTTAGLPDLSITVKPICDDAKLSYYDDYTSK